LAETGPRHGNDDDDDDEKGIMTTDQPRRDRKSPRRILLLPYAASRACRRAPARDDSGRVRRAMPYGPPPPATNTALDPLAHPSMAGGGGCPRH
jgi:hypothetical protein